MLYAVLITLGSWLLIAMGLHVAPPGIVPGDGPELGLAAFKLAAAHPPGYPLYILFGHLSEFLPFGSPAFRLSIFSILAQTVAFVWLACILRDRIPASVPSRSRDALSTSVAFFCVTGPLLLTQCAGAEVYALHLALTVWLLGLALKPSPRHFLMAAFAFGVGLSNHHLTLMVLPALVWSYRSFFGNRKMSLTALVLMVMGLSTYLLLPLRGGFVAGAGALDLSHLGPFWGHLTRAVYGGDLSSGPWWDAFLGIGFYLWIFLKETWWVGAILAGLGFWVSGKRVLAPETLGFLGILLLVPCLNRVYPDARQQEIVSAFFPTALVWASPWMLSGLRWVNGAIRSRKVWRAVAGLLLVFLSAHAVFAVRSADASRDLSAEDMGRNVLMNLPRGASLVTGGDVIAFPTDYLHKALGLRADAEVGGISEIRVQHGSRFVSETLPDKKMKLAGLFFQENGPVVETKRLWPRFRGPRLSRDPGILTRETVASFYAFRGMGHAEGWRNNEALADFKIAEIVAGPHGMVLANLGNQMMVYGWTQQALELFDKATRFAPQLPAVWLNRALAAEKLGKPEEAEKFYLKSLAYGPTNGWARNRLAMIYLDRGKDDLAAAQWEKSIKKSPAFPNAYRNLGLLLMEREPVRGRELLKRYFRMVPNAPENADLEKRLKLTNP